MSTLNELLNKKKSEYNKFWFKGTEMPVIPRLPLGIFAYDLLTNGGNPRGKIIQYWGAKGSGKTTTAFRAIGAFLSTFKKDKAVFVDFEHKYNPDWAKNFIAKEDLDRVLVVIPDYAEQGIDMIEYILKADDTNFMVVDSVAAMTPTAMSEKSAIEDTMGLQPKVVNKLLRKLVPLMVQAKRNGRLITTLLINQIRAKIGVRSFTPLTDTPCGNMLEHALSLDIKFVEESYVEISKIPVAVVHKFTVMKNMLGLKKRTGRFTVQTISYNNRPAGFVDETETVLDYAKKSGGLERNGNLWKYESKVFKNLAELNSFFEGNPKELLALKNKTLELCMKDILLTGEEENV